MAQKPNKAEFMLSLAARAGKAASGETAAEHAVRTGKAWVVIVAEDASDNTKKKFTNKCHYYGTPVYIYSTKQRLAHVIGRELRSVVAVTDEKMASAVIEKLEEMDVHGEE